MKQLALLCYKKSPDGTFAKNVYTLFRKVTARKSRGSYFCQKGISRSYTLNQPIKSQKYADRRNSEIERVWGTGKQKIFLK